jgi:hypothetical protein
MGFIAVSVFQSISKTWSKCTRILSQPLEYLIRGLDEVNEGIGDKR